MRKERRRAPRTFSNLPLDLCDPKNQAVIGEGRFINVSLTGSLLESRQPLRLQQPIRLLVQTPGKSPFQFAGRVVWKKKKSSVFNYGIQFESVAASLGYARQSMAYKEVA